jgi:hypothetical protein
MEHLGSAHPTLKPLVVLHHGRTMAPQARQPLGAELLRYLRENNCFYAAPVGSNDDW